MIVYQDEASFRQTPTLYRTWARRGHQPQIPTRGERHTQKVLACISHQILSRIEPEAHFGWRFWTRGALGKRDTSSA